MIDPVRALLRNRAGEAAVRPVDGICEGRRWLAIPVATAGCGAWKPRPARTDICRGIGVVNGGSCSVSGDVYDATGMRLRNFSHKQRLRRRKSWIKDKIARYARCRASAERIDGPVLNLAASTSSMYFHWLIDVLPRYFIADTSGYARDRFIYVPQGRPFQDETLAALELQERVIDADEIPLVYSDDLAVPCHQLSCGHLPPSWVVDFLRNTLFPKVANEKSDFGKRIYVSRNDAARRHVLNEEVVVDALAPLGFEKITPGLLSVRDQMSAFAGADIIVGTHGSGLANIVFCKPGTILVELFSNVYFDDGPYRLSQAAGLTYFYVRERVPHAGGTPVATDYEVEPGDVLETLDVAIRMSH